MTDQRIADLAARCEKAEGPDRELDAEIAVALGYERDGDELWFDGETYSIREPDYYDLEGQNRELRFFTASLDAALTLVPEGHVCTVSDWWCDDDDERGPHFADCGNRELLTSGMDCEVYQAWAASKPLALCAAALRARAAP